MSYLKNLFNQWPRTKAEDEEREQLRRIVEREKKVFPLNSGAYGKHYSYSDHLRRIKKAEGRIKEIQRKIKMRRLKVLFPFLPVKPICRNFCQAAAKSNGGVWYPDETDER